MVRRRVRSLRTRMRSGRADRDATHSPGPQPADQAVSHFYRAGKALRRRWRVRRRELPEGRRGRGVDGFVRGGIQLCCPTTSSRPSSMARPDPTQLGDVIDLGSSSMTPRSRCSRSGSPFASPTSRTRRIARTRRWPRGAPAARGARARPQHHADPRGGVPPRRRGSVRRAAPAPRSMMELQVLGGEHARRACGLVMPSGGLLLHMTQPRPPPRGFPAAILPARRKPAARIVSSARLRVRLPGQWRGAGWLGPAEIMRERNDGRVARLSRRCRLAPGCVGVVHLSPSVPT